MKNFKESLERIEVEEPVHIPTLDGKNVAETVHVKVPAWRDPKNGEIYLDTEATAILDRVKARHMGLLTPEQIKALRQRMGLTQRQISELLQIGEKTWTRWETGRERPFRSINVLLCALRDGKIDLPYLCSLVQRRQDWGSRLAALPVATQNPWVGTARNIWTQWEWQHGGACAADAAAWRLAIIGELMKRKHQTEFGFNVETKPTAVWKRALIAFLHEDAPGFTPEYKTACTFFICHCRVKFAAGASPQTPARSCSPPQIAPPPVPKLDESIAA